MWLSDTAIKRPVTTLMFAIGIMIFGYISFENMGVDLFPEVDIPVVTVTTTLSGADPEIMDTDVTDPIEEQVNAIEGVKSIRSTSTEGRSNVVIEFVLEKDIDIAAQEVRDKVNLAGRDLPEDIDPPIIDKVDTSSSPIVWVAVTTTGNYREMANWADKVLKERIQTVRGVGAIWEAGLRERVVRIWVDPGKMEARGLSATDISNAVKVKHVELPGGRIEQPERELVIKVKGEYETVEELKELVIKSEDGTLVRLKDVGEVLDGSEDLRSFSRFNGLPTVGLGVQKQSGANTVDVAKAIKKIVEKMANVTPKDVRIQIASDSSTFINSSMNGVLIDLLFGVILTSLVMLMFLRNARMTFISLMSIPTSLIATFSVMYALGFTINNMTMLAMSLAIGIVIDDTVVVMENIFRHVEEGKNPYEAAGIGTSQVGLAVIAASTSIMAVFFPVAFMKGIIGRFFFQFGLSVAFAVLISVIISLTLAPMLCSKILKYSPDPKHGKIFTLFEKMFNAMDSLYVKTIDWVLQHIFITLAGATIAFIIGFSFIPFIGKAFFTNADESMFIVRFEFPTGYSISHTDSYAKEIEKIILSQDEVKSAFMAVGFGGMSVNAGMMFINLVKPHEREISQSKLMNKVRTELNKTFPQARFGLEYSSPVGGGGRSADIQYVIQGPNIEELDKVSGNIMEGLKSNGGFIDIDNDLRLNKPEYRVYINRNLADDLGVDVYTIAENFRLLFEGDDIAKFKEGGERYDVRLKAFPEARVGSEDLDNIALRSTGGNLVKTPNLINFRESTGPQSINRFNRSRATTIYANMEEIPLGTGLSIMDDLAEKYMPDNPMWSTALMGQSSVFKESFGYLLIALAIAILLIYMILGAQFESFIHPFTIMMSLPLAVIGGVGLLMIMGKNLDIFAFIGFIMLVGIVTKNAILLVDFTNQLRRKGYDKYEALKKAAPLRLRPILMTAFTTIASVIPVALGLSEGGEQRASMGVAVVGGMITSTVLTLVVIPCVYIVMDNVSHFLKHILGLGKLDGV